MEINEELERKFNKAKIKLMGEKNSVFLSTILFSLQHIWTEEIPTAATDGARLLLNPTWIETMSKDELVGLLAHESWHVAFNHIFRQGDRDHARFNKAADHVINLMILESGGKLPEGGLHDPQYKGMSTEQVYNLLPEEPKEPESSDGWGGDDIIKPDAGDSPSQRKAKENAVEDIIVRAATQAKMAKEAGSIPGDIQRELDKLLNPKLDWRTILQNYMSAFAKDDYSYRKPNRRFFPDHFLPSAYSEAIGEIAFAVDTSGSVSDRQFQAFLTEMNSVKERLDPEIMTVIDFDTRINNVISLSRDQDISSVTFSGGGGTNLTPVFEHYAKKPPVVLVVFSDLYCIEIEQDPGYPVIWAVVDNPNAKVNFGQKFDYDTTDL